MAMWWMQTKANSMSVHTFAHSCHTVALIHVGTERDRIRLLPYVMLKRKNQKYYYLHHLHSQTDAHTDTGTRTHTPPSPFTHKLYRKTHNKKMLKKGEHMNIEQVFRRSDLFFLSFTQCSRPHNSVSHNHFDSFSPHFTSYLFMLIKHHISIHRRT